MTKSATDLVQDAINAAVVDAIVALKNASQGLPNALLRDINAIHANTAFADLPDAVRQVVSNSTRDLFGRLRTGGYVVADSKAVAPARPAPTPDRSRDRPRSGPRPGGGQRPGPRPDGPRPGGPRRPPGDKKR